MSHDEENLDEGEVFPEDAEISAARARRFMQIKQLLFAPSLAHLRPPPQWASARRTRVGLSRWGQLPAAPSGEDDRAARWVSTARRGRLHRHA